ncbi:DUF6382 domain-containing protein [Paenibacillus sp. GCM10027627]|uniref:DUF6382 domain-containing protein n=1 Tax=unclassified Paenibacillus TaxID=185978 RepID=UPI0036274AA1
MHSLKIDFAMNRAHEMIVGREHGIGRSELDELELIMLRSQPIPCLLPVDWLEVDGNVSFRYTITGKKMLVHRLQHELLTMHQFYSLILALTDALMECKEYMLRPEGCLLHEQYIFTGERIENIFLAYLPIKRACEVPSRQVDDLLSLVVRWTSYVEPVDGTGLKRILQLLSHSLSPLPDLRDALLELIAAQGGIKHSDDWNMEKAQQPLLHEASSRQRAEELLKWPPLQGEGTFVEEDANKEELLPFIDDSIEVNRKGKAVWVIGAGCLLVAACIWRFIYLESPSTSRLLICTGLTLLLIGAFLYWRRTGSDVFLTEKTEGESEDSLEPVSEALRPKVFWKPIEEEMEVTTGSLGHFSIPANVRSRRDQDVDIQKTMHPTVALGAKAMRAEEVTSLLSFGKPNVWLKRVWNGKEEKIDLDADSFKIGRMSEGVSYEELEEGVSRLHLEIARINGEFYVKDLGSRNGSLLNGKLMVPYKSYKLSPGDRVQLAGHKGPVYELGSD